MADEQSFSAAVKAELSPPVPDQPCCRRMELGGLVRAIGRVELHGGGRVALSLSTDSAPVSRKVIRLLRAVSHVEYKVMVMRRRKLRKNLVYRIYIPPQPGVGELLQIAGFIDERGNLTEWAEPLELANDHCRRAYLRGTFLGSGWIASPEKQHHLELSTTATEAADALGQMLFSYGIAARLAARRDALILYVKEADQIIRFLGVIGAHQALLRYEEVRVLKEMKNRVNRQVNAEMANVAKQADAAARQVEAIERLRAAGALSSLPAPLRELAALRLAYPDASLKELGELCRPPVSKSGAAHRMRQLMALSDSLM
ncbi:DNA-binding protein WhiA [Symbiobacterium terraclitae]|uniref:Probable cell division protein WhiA n=1 Tax=Symbiobacterium terraclitae TaxID=557451 RepID=A0ABS4JR74_9FIRM|nr:DNA-binding protein WhiA [Symbiobacterium terraclitae]